MRDMGRLGAHNAGHYWLLLVGAALIGIGSAVFHPEASRVARLASGGRFGLAQSLFQVGGNFGQSLGPLLAAFIVVPFGQGSVSWFTALAAIGERDEMAGAENVLAAEAARQGKRFSSLETLDEQLGVLSGLSPETERHFLAITLNEIEQQDTANVADMDRAWARGDTATLDRLFAEQWRESGDALHEAIILNRNRAWADEIERRLHGSGRIFIAVGAAHLIGDGSVVDLLRARGIEVEGP